jgi:uncharacterized pyridoxamine 5'-phosphate oxidase family protein
MTKEEVFEFITKNPVFALATVEGNQPRVRYMMLYRADENGIIFSTGQQKDVHQQLQANSQVEMCFQNPDSGQMVRISGKVEVLEELELKKRIVDDYPFLREWVDSEGYDVLITYRLRGGMATTWTMETNFTQKEFIDL